MVGGGEGWWDFALEEMLHWDIGCMYMSHLCKATEMHMISILHTISCCN